MAFFCVFNAGILQPRSDIRGRPFWLIRNEDENDMKEKKKYSRIVFLDANAAFSPPETDSWSLGCDLEELAASLDKRPRDWSRETYCYREMLREAPGYWEELDRVANHWSKDATRGFAEVLEKHDAGFVLSSEIRETMGRGALASLFALHDLDLRFADMTVSPSPLFSDALSRKVVEGTADRSLLELYTRTMRSLWSNLSEDGDGVRRIDHRTVEILEYLDRHPEIESFAVVDDRDLSAGIGNDRMVPCDNVLDEGRLGRLDAALQSRQAVPRLPPCCRTDELRRFRETCVPVLYRRWRDPAYSGRSDY